MLHRWLGLTTGLVVLVVSLTGCIYVFEEEWRQVFQHNYLHVETPGVERKSISTLAVVVQKAYPKEKITQLRFLEEKDAAFVFHTKNKLAISINPYTAELLGHRDLKTDFMSVVLELHLNLMMGEVGEEIVRWNVLIFFIMCISGLVLWWPRQRRFLKTALSVKWRTPNWRRRNWDLHSVLGFYALFVLFIISLTGLFWVFDTSKNIVSALTGSPVWKLPEVASTPSLLKKENPLDTAYLYTKAAHPGARQVFITVPKDSIEPIRVLFRYPYAIVRKQTTAFFDQYSIANLHTDTYQKYTRYEYISRSIYDFHTGRIRALGIGSKIIYFLASLFAASLPVTGTLIWWGRRKKKRISERENITVKPSVRARVA